jgi:hypothetical protein
MGRRQNHINSTLWPRKGVSLMVGMTMLAVSRSLPTCALFKAYIGERVWKSIGDTLRGPCYLSGDDHDRKIRARKQTSVNTLL